jgi:hypothetical protein
MSVDGDDVARLRALADSLDCLTEDDLVLLANVEPATVESWRRRGTGPGVILAGRRYLYPRAAVAEWLAGRLRKRRTDAKAQL